MNGQPLAAAQYADRLKVFRKSDEERDALVAEILRNYEDLQLKFVEKCDDYNNEVESRRLWQTKARSTEMELKATKQVSSSNNFAVAVIDGDGAVFQDYLYNEGKDGGADGAHQLYTELRNHLSHLYPDSNVSDWPVVVQVVLNLQGLGTKLQACSIISNVSELVNFGRAFSLAQPLFNFIDVGSGKERADHKIRETLRLFLPNAQCKHVFFGPCHDNGYLPVLEPYRLDENIAAKLTLLETLPAAPGFLGLGLGRMRCPRIFRTENLPAKPVEMMAAPSHSPALPIRSPPTSNLSPGLTIPQPPPKPSNPPPGSIPTATADSPTSNSWATVGKAGSISKTINVASKKASAKKFIMLNVNDERLDPPLPQPDPNAYKRFNERFPPGSNACNNYHLLGKCSLGEYCDYVHGEKLSPGETLVLRHKVRGLRCPAEDGCRDFDCYLGHHCKFGSACKMEYCRFSDTHGIEREPAKKYYEDSPQEWLSSYLERTGK